MMMNQFNRALLLLFLFLLPYAFVLSKENDDYIIKQFKVKDGLSQSSILAILQDRRGFMWFATGSGLNKYDGYTFKVYLNNPQDSLSISDNGISALYEDRDGYIWVGTTGGFVNRFDRQTETFRRININLSMNPSRRIEDNYYVYPLLFSRNSDNSITSIYWHQFSQGIFNHIHQVYHFNTFTVWISFNFYQSYKFRKVNSFRFTNR